MDSPVAGRKLNFVLQQGLEAPPAASCARTYASLLFQPRVVGVIAVVGTALQSPVVFFALAALLWWGAALPRWNVFEAVYNSLIAARSGMRLGPAPPPRRFAQMLAGLFAFAIGALFAAGLRVAAFAVAAFFLIAVGALVFGGFCIGSYVFHLIAGRSKFANATLPWAS